MARSLYSVLKSPESGGGSDEDLVEEVLASLRRFQDEDPLCDSCSNTHLLRAGCARWLDVEGDAMIMSSIFNLQ
jgi:hypothetical protein